jgi:osmotically-inducible protein OsmY
MPTCFAPVIRVCALMLVVMLAAACGRSDATIASDASAQFQADDLTKGFSITPQVQKGMVTLTGQTQTHAQHDRAAEIARGVKGVKDVLNQITVADDALAEAVKQAIAREPALAAIPLDVEVIDETVWLKSAATDAEQRKQLVAIARAVPGVEGVEDLMK